MTAQYKDGMIYPPLPKQTEGYHGDYWTDDDLTGYALDFWEANTTPQPAQGDALAELIAAVEQYLTTRIPSYERISNALKAWKSANG